LKPNKFHIDGGFLYYDDAARGYRLCVPSGYSPVRTVENNSDGSRSKSDRKPELKRKDCLGGDDGSAKAQSDVAKSKTTLREQLIDQLHSDPMIGHRGTNATQSLVADRFYWKQLNSDVSKWVYGCSTCRKAKFDRTKRQGCLQPVQVPNAPGRCYNMDMIVDLPETEWHGERVSKVLAMVDRFTKRTFLMTLPGNATSQLVASSIYQHVVCDQDMGLMAEIVADHDPLFTSKMFRTWADRLGIHLSIASARSQQTNGLAERTIATIEEILRTRIDLRQLTWPSLLPVLHVLVPVPVALPQVLKTS